MNYYNVTGGNKLNGETSISGAKNAVLPILAAVILNKSEVEISNCPNISDTLTSIKILESLGCKTHFENNILKVNTEQIVNTEIPTEFAKSMRSSIIFLGGLIGRFKEARISYPGGCELGARPIDLHIKSLKKLGVEIVEEHGYINCSAKKLKGADIVLDFPSVGATENIMIAAVLAEGRTTIINPAKEPEIVDLEKFLNSMGAKITGSGTTKITIDGVAFLKNTKHKVMPDRIVAGTLMIGAAITKGEILLRDILLDDMSQIISALEETGCSFKNYSNNETCDLLIKSPNKINRIKHLTTNPHPAFPTDLQPQLVAYLSVAEGTSIINESIFESRHKHIPELNKMGADIFINNDGKTFVISGGSTLKAAVVESKDLRGGAALILAGLAAEGTTTILGANYIERGYEEIEKTLAFLGADIIYHKD